MSYTFAPEYDIYLPRGMNQQGGEQHYYPASQLENDAMLKRLDDLCVYYIELGIKS